jgi:indolepyruvate ferredoxin oxidoreductase beta subunit
MAKSAILKDPYNIIITGVGGQGNVLASRLLGSILSSQGYTITIGETFGASQRGGSVMSHMRVSKDRSWSPQIPTGGADLIMGIEPTETVRVLANYGNSNVKTITNMRPVHSCGVISGEQKYPDMGNLKEWISELSESAWFLQATEEALVLGKAIYSNIIMVGALVGTRVLPITRNAFETVISTTMSSENLTVNLKAFDRGVELVQG